MSSIVLCVVLMLPLFIAVLLMQAAKSRHARYKNPLTRSLRRPPGAELGRQLGAEQLEAGFGVFEVVLPSLMLACAYIIAQNMQTATVKWFVLVAVLCIALVMWTVAIRKLIRRLETIRVLRLGYECELAVGQELDLLMLNGWRVFHDIPAQGFNIDHVVVGPQGVFAVETKGRSKRVPERDEKSSKYKVKYTSGCLEFPYYRDTETVPQAVRQAKWLSTWLTSATAMQVDVAPVVVLPGWFVETADRPTVPVIASGFIAGFFKGRPSNDLSGEAVARIVHQLDVMVRDLEPGEVVRPK